MKRDLTLTGCSGGVNVHPGRRKGYIRCTLPVKTSVLLSFIFLPWFSGPNCRRGHLNVPCRRGGNPSEQPDFSTAEKQEVVQPCSRCTLRQFSAKHTLKKWSARHFYTTLKNHSAIFLQKEQFWILSQFFCLRYLYVNVSVLWTNFVPWKNCGLHSLFFVEISPHTEGLQSVEILSSILNNCGNA